MTQLDLFEWGASRPTAEIIDFIDVLVPRIQDGRLKYGLNRETDATVYQLWTDEKGEVA